MSFHALMAVFLLLTSLVSCGEDIARKQKNKPTGPEVIKPPLGAEGLISSQMHRLRGFNVISYLEEIEQTLKGTLPITYKPIPNMQLDDEGIDLKNVITMKSVVRPTAICGEASTFVGINARISDCKLKNGEHALWSGHLYGAAGEGTWQLVSFSTAGKEIWLDVRTGMVWSDVVNTENWCKASGNKETATTIATVDCASVGEDQSFCVGANIDGLGNNVRWRLPTRNDFLQADINGFRFVMKSGSALGSWTATLVAASEDREHGWVYYLPEGILKSQELTSKQLIRCIGAPVR